MRLRTSRLALQSQSFIDWYCEHIVLCESEARMDSLSFKTIDLARDQSIALKFREDSFVVSFGNADQFYEYDGQGHVRYLEWLKAKIEKDARFAVHVWQGDQIIGQLELGKPRNDPTVGYVNLYYLIPEKRGVGRAFRNLCNWLGYMSFSYA